MTPSAPAHFAYTTSATSFTVSRVSGASARAAAFHSPATVVSTKFSTGAPAMIPSKSPGNRCAEISACRPPVEQPSQYA